MSTDKKNWHIKPDTITEILDWEGLYGCFATDRITVYGAAVGYMYRENPDSDLPDSGWRFTAGDEDEEYIDNPDNTGIYRLNTIANYDPEIINFLKAPHGSALYRDEAGTWREDLDLEDSR